MQQHSLRLKTTQNKMSKGDKEMPENIGHFLQTFQGENAICGKHFIWEEHKYRKDIKTERGGKQYPQLPPMSSYTRKQSVVEVGCGLLFPPVQPLRDWR